MRNTVLAPSWNTWKLPSVPRMSQKPYLKDIVRQNISDSNGWTDMKRIIKEGRVAFRERVKY